MSTSLLVPNASDSMSLHFVFAGKSPTDHSYHGSCCSCGPCLPSYSHLFQKCCLNLFLIYSVTLDGSELQHHQECNQLPDDLHRSSRGPHSNPPLCPSPPEILTERSHVFPTSCYAGLLLERGEKCATSSTREHLISKHRDRLAPTPHSSSSQASSSSPLSCSQLSSSVIFDHF